MGYLVRQVLTGNPFVLLPFVPWGCFLLVFCFYGSMMVVTILAGVSHQA